MANRKKRRPSPACRRCGGKLFTYYGGGANAVVEIGGNHRAYIVKLAFLDATVRCVACDKLQGDPCIIDKVGDAVRDPKAVQT